MRRAIISNGLHPNVAPELRTDLGLTTQSIDPIDTYYVSVAETERLVRACRGRILFVAVRQFACNTNQEGTEPGTLRGREVQTHLTVGKRQALKFLVDAYGRVRDTHTVRIAFSQRCFFIG